jgi:signal transduction histidine kinase/streptogramin lyase
MYFGTSDGLACLEDSVLAPCSKEFSFTYPWVNKLLVDREGVLWVGTNGGGLRSYRDARPVVPAPAGFYGDVIMALHDDGSGTIWIGAEKGTLTRVANGALRTFTLKGVRGVISAILRDREGALWVGTDEGALAHFIEPDSLLYFFRGSGPVSSLMEDREGNIWAGVEGGGLHRITRGKFTTYTVLDGLANDFIHVIYPDPDGTVWIGSMGGLNRLTGDVFVSYLTNERMPIEGITALHRGRDGSLWIGSSSGLSRTKNGRYEVVWSKKGLPSGLVRGIAEDDKGNILVTTRQGLIVSSNPWQSMPVFRPYGDSLLQQPLWCIHVSQRTGDVWISTWGAGLLRVSSQGRVSRYSTESGLTTNIIRSIFEDAEGVLWFGSYAGGLHRFKDGKFTSYSVDDGLFDEKAYAILEDGNGNLWISCNRGVYRVSKHELNEFAEGVISSLSCISYGTADGMKTFECNGGYQPSGCKSTDGRLWFATLRGATVINPGAIPVNAVPPAVVIEHVAIDGSTVDPTIQAHVGPGNGELKFTYTALSFVAPDRVRFRYRLEGFDQTWVDAQDRRAAYYTNIPPGTYTFRVIASNNDGVWNDAGTAFTFTLAPHFYQTTWFYALSALLTALLGSVVYHLYQTYKNREKIASRLQAQLAQAELQVLKMQLQPHFLFNTLHAISSLMHKDLEAADEMMANLGDFLRYTLESVGVQEVELGQELEILNRYLEIEHVRLGNRLSVRQQVPADLLAAMVPNLILQPIVENAIRYGIARRASGGSVEITATRANGRIRIAVSDDGEGLPAGSREGIGLSNTRARLEQLYGTNHAFFYVNRPEGGLCVTLEFPFRIGSNAHHESPSPRSVESAHTYR